MMVNVMFPIGSCDNNFLTGDEMVTFLFGAGADVGYGLHEGTSFISPLLLDGYKKERKQLLGENVGTYKLIYPQSTKVYLQTVFSYKNEAKNIFSEKEVNKLINYYNGDSDEREKLKDYAHEFCKKIYGKIKDSVGNKNFDDIELKFFIDNAVFFDSIDEKFNALRCIPLNSNGKRVLNAYATIFITMMKSRYNIGEKFKWSYPNIFKFLCENGFNYEKCDDTYYSALSELQNDKYSIVTTNYTNIAERVTQSDVIYLHGNLTWFEDYKNLTVYDCLIDSERDEALKNLDTIMPFIFIPSGVKPIVCKKEILEFCKFIEQLSKSKILCVVGYKFNSEDNHINSIIADWLRAENHILLYFNFKKSLDLKKLTWISDSFSIKEFELGENIDFEKTLNQNKNNIVNINIDETTSFNCFKGFVNYVKQQSADSQ
jgi:hypothetical protein